jgi:hypothetical protein
VGGSRDVSGKGTPATKGDLAAVRTVALLPHEWARAGDSQLELLAPLLLLKSNHQG